MVIEATKTEFGYIKPTQIVDEMRSSYLDYAMSVIVSRALPDIRDGLKPVQRRILYAMQDLAMRPNSSHKKSARLVGEVLGKWHPHGEGAVYDALVRMAQPFSLRMPLVDGQGNFGSVDNDPPAAMRYTEARMAPVAEEMLANIDQNTVDFAENFDGSLSEPEVLPARLPNLLVNGASGIAVGMATNIPPHNPIEVCDALIHLADHPSASVEDLMKFVRGPDFPTGGIIMGTDGIQSAYSTGRGQIVVRAKARVEPMRRSNRMQIIVSELPYQVNKAALVEKVAALVKDRKIEGISDLRDESDREGMRVVFELRAGVQPMVVLNNLYKFTAMQSSFSANMLALVDKMPRVITLRQALQQFLEFRQEVVRRRTEFELAKARQRAHILAGLRIAISHLDEVINLIRNSESAQVARQQLIARFGLDDDQAQAILDMQLRRLAALEREQLEKEYQEIQDSIRKMEELLADDRKVLAEVKKELRALKKKHGDERRTEITAEASDLSREELEPHEQIVVTISQGGYIKRIPASTFRNQHRGGKGVGGMTTRDNDAVKHLLVVDTHDKLLFFTNKGRVYSMTAFELRADTSRTTRGVPILNVISAGSTEKVTAVIGMSENEFESEDCVLVLATAKGKIKRIALSTVANVRPSGYNMMSLSEDDELVSVRPANPKDSIMMVTQNGKALRFDQTEVRLYKHRGGGGVKGMKLVGEDRVISMDVGPPSARLLVISKLGMGKITPLSSYRKKGRGGMGVKTLNVTAKTGPVADAQIIDDTKEEVYVVSEQAQVIRTNLSEIRNAGRNTQGVTIFKPSEGDSVTSISCVSDLNLIEEKAANQSATPKAKKPAKAASTNGRRNGRVNGAQSRLDGIE
ncbi:MAG: DNA gyrase subunit A [Dehalococcoidia bacterium]|nr:DNA gyrase subunit A [Dehalococcoidia bacterium]